eukprot:gene10312-12388_t
MASGYLPSHDGHEVFMYSSGQPNTHGEWQPGLGPGGRNAWGRNTGVRILRLRKDGWVSVAAPYVFGPNLTALPNFLTLPVTVPSGCPEPVPKALPPPPGGDANVTCAYQLPSARCEDAGSGRGWHNVSCASDGDCSRLCGSCHCHGVPATCRARAGGRGYCDTGEPGG